MPHKGVTRAADLHDKLCKCLLQAAPSSLRAVKILCLWSIPMCLQHRISRTHL